MKIKKMEDMGVVTMVATVVLIILLVLPKLVGELVFIMELLEKVVEYQIALVTQLQEEVVVIMVVVLVKQK